MLELRCPNGLEDDRSQMSAKRIDDVPHITRLKCGHEWTRAAQFMPGTAAAYGLSDPFNALAAIDAQAHLMSDLLNQFGSIPLALAAYNAGPGAVEACGCASPYAETQAYVTRILALLGGAGEILAPPLEVRLVE